jgi:spermidine synthase
MCSLSSERAVLARHITPSGEIQLQQRPLPDGSLAFEIISNGVFLMASYNQLSARALAHYALEAAKARPCSELRILVGGLGMGFTLQEILTTDVALVDVVEISPYIIEWNHAHFAPLNGSVLADPRVRLIQDDLYTVMCTASTAAYDAITLDVDNGPSWLVHERNARLYTFEALERWSAMLKPGGSFTVWSAQPEPEFLERMQTIFGRAEEIPVVAPNHRKEPVEYYIYQNGLYQCLFGLSERLWSPERRSSVSRSKIEDT